MVVFYLHCALWGLCTHETKIRSHFVRCTDHGRRVPSDTVPQWVAPDIRQQVWSWIKESKCYDFSYRSVWLGERSGLRWSESSIGTYYLRERPRNESKNIDQPPTAFWGPNQKAGVIISCGLIQSCGKICDLFGFPLSLAVGAIFSSCFARSHCEPMRVDETEKPDEIDLRLWAARAFVIGVCRWGCNGLSIEIAIEHLEAI